MKPLVKPDCPRKRLLRPSLAHPPISTIMSGATPITLELASAFDLLRALASAYSCRQAHYAIIAHTRAHRHPYHLGWPEDKFDSNLMKVPTTMPLFKVTALFPLGDFPTHDRLDRNLCHIPRKALPPMQREAHDAYMGSPPYTHSTMLATQLKAIFRPASLREMKVPPIGKARLSLLTFTLTATIAVIDPRAGSSPFMGDIGKRLLTKCTHTSEHRRETREGEQNRRWADGKRKEAQKGDNQGSGGSGSSTPNTPARGAPRQGGSS